MMGEYVAGGYQSLEKMCSHCPDSLEAYQGFEYEIERVVSPGKRAGMTNLEVVAAVSETA